MRGEGFSVNLRMLCTQDAGLAKRIREIQRLNKQRVTKGLPPLSLPMASEAGQHGRWRLGTVQCFIR